MDFGTATLGYIRTKLGILKPTDTLLSSNEVGAAAYFGVGEGHGQLLEAGMGGVLSESTRMGIHYPARQVPSASGKGPSYLLLCLMSDQRFTIQGKFRGRRGTTWTYGERCAEMDVQSAHTVSSTETGRGLLWILTRYSADVAALSFVTLTFEGEQWLAIEQASGKGAWHSALQFHGFCTRDPSDFEWAEEADVSDVVPYVPASTPIWQINGNNVWTERNATVDSNGFLVESSPVIRLFSDKIEDNGQVGHAEFTRNGTGDYTITDTLGFAQEGWYVKTPQDANGNIKVFVEYEYVDGEINVRTFEPLYDQGKATNGDPVDIPDGRWIDIRLHEEPSVEVEVDEVDESDQEDEKDVMGD